MEWASRSAITTTMVIQICYVTNYGKNILYHNNGDGTFTDVTAKAGVADGSWSVSAGFFDYDNDGHLDLFVTRTAARKTKKCTKSLKAAKAVASPKSAPMENFKTLNMKGEL